MDRKVFVPRTDKSGQFRPASSEQEGGSNASPSPTAFGTGFDAARLLYGNSRPPKEVIGRVPTSLF